MLKNHILGTPVVTVSVVPSSLGLLIKAEYLSVAGEPGVTTPPNLQPRCPEATNQELEKKQLPYLNMCPIYIYIHACIYTCIHIYIYIYIYIDV